MPQFSVNPSRLDPYKNFKFRLICDGRPVAGVSRISGLKRVTEVIAHREGGDPSTKRVSPGATRYEPIVIERGVTHDTDFEDWANRVHAFGGGRGHEMSLADFRKDVRLELFNEAGQIVLAYNIFRCWPSEFEALPDLDADVSAVAIQRLVLQNEGWERDVDVAEPQEPRSST